MTPTGIAAAQARAWDQMRRCAHPGTYQSREPETDDAVLPAAVVTGSTTLEATPGGLARVRTATVFLSKCCHPSEPIIKQRVTVTAEGREAADYRIEDFHDQAAEHWVIRCVQWPK